MSILRAIERGVQKFRKRIRHKKHCHCHVCFENRKGHVLKKEQEDTFDSMKELSED